MFKGTKIESAGLMKLEAVAALVRVASPNTIRRWASVGNFPAPVALSPRIKLWRKADVLAWMAERGLSVADELKESPSSALKERLAAKRGPGIYDPAVDLDSLEPSAPWLMAGWLRAGELGVIYGAPEARPDKLALRVAWAIAAGERTFCSVPTAGAPVTYLCPEPSERFDDDVGGMTKRVGKAKRLRICTDPLDLGSDVDVGVLIDGVNGHHRGHGLIVIGALGAATPGIDLATHSGTSTVLQALDALRSETGCAILLVDHNGHPDNPEPPELYVHKNLYESLDMSVGVWCDGESQEWDCQRYADELTITVS
ncbi:hypothetical protein GCM10027093_08950 [Paraburkholderia jirisanensis]